MYGPTETTIWSTCRRIVDPDGPILVGKPIDNTKIYILDDQLCPVPIGVTGELCIGGDGVTLGYMNLPEQTSKSFISNPFTDERTAGMIYKTGDLGRYVTGGDIEHCGRKDNQVKVRGFRIELGEIENTLTGLDTIKQAICVVKEFSAGDTRIAAYVVQDRSNILDEMTLKDYLGEKLPVYMIPQHFVDIDVLPLTPAGKIDRKKLQADLVIGGEGVQGEYIAPETDTEKAVAAIWAEILKLDQIGKNDNFFNIGGHSLLAARVISRINKEFNLIIKLGELFQRPTIEGLAFKIDGMKGDPGETGSREVFEF
jgi:acyl carrier protein